MARLPESLKQFIIRWMSLNEVAQPQANEHHSELPPEMMKSQIMLSERVIFQ